MVPPASDPPVSTPSLMAVGSSAAGDAGSAASRSIPYALPSDALEGLLHLAAHVALTETAALFLQQGASFWVLATSGVSTASAHTAALLLADVLQPESADYVFLDASVGPEPVALIAAALASRPGFLVLHRFAVDSPDCHVVLALAHSFPRPQFSEETRSLLSEIARQIALRMEARAEKRELEASRQRRIQRDRFLESVAAEGTLGQCLVDGEGHVRTANESLLRELQLPRASVLGRRFEEVFAFETAFGDEDASHEPGRLSPLIQWDRVIDTPCVLRQPSGTLIRMMATATTVRLQDGTDAWCVSLAKGDAQSIAPLQNPGGNLRVLIAEDHPVNQRVIQGMVEKLGLSADVVSNGLEAVHAACHQKYAAILMDCQMPDMDGIEATRFIRSNEDRIGRVPIVAVTAFGHEEDRLRCFDAGVDEYMVKPIRIEVLGKILAQWAPVTVDPDSLPFAAVESGPQDQARVEISHAIQRLSADLDEELVREVVVLFLEDTRVRIEEIRKLSASQDWTQLYAAAHKVKGSCGSLGAQALMAECERLENLARSGSRDQIEDCIERVSQHFERIAPILREHIDRFTT